MTKDFVRLLKAAPLFQGVEQNGLLAIAQAASEISKKDGAQFFAQGDTADRVFLLTSGGVRITQITSEGNQVIVRLISPGEIFGVVGGFGKQRYPASAVADGNAQAIYWNSNTLRDLMRKIPELGANVAAELSSRVQEMQDRLRELSTERVERRIARLLLRLATKVGKRQSDGILIDLKLSRQDIAEMCSTTLFTVSRVLKGWEKDGLVSVGRQKVKILKAHSLVEIAEELQKGSNDL